MYIYALKNRTTDLVYYGSTKQTLNRRFIVHKSQHKRGDTYLQNTASQVLSCPTAYIELCEEVNEDNMDERERWWIENNPCVNKRLPLQTQKEWRIKNREKLNEYNKLRRRNIRQQKSLNNLRPVDTSV